MQGGVGDEQPLAAVVGSNVKEATRWATKGLEVTDATVKMAGFETGEVGKGKEVVESSEERTQEVRIECLGVKLTLLFNLGVLSDVSVHHTPLTQRTNSNLDPALYAFDQTDGGRQMSSTTLLPKNLRSGRQDRRPHLQHGQAEGCRESGPSRTTGCQQVRSSPQNTLRNANVHSDTMQSELRHNHTSSHAKW